MRNHKVRSAYPIPTLYHLVAYPVPGPTYPVPYRAYPILALAYPAPPGAPRPRPQPGGRNHQVQPAYPGPPKKKFSHQDKHSATAPLNNFFTFTYPGVRRGPRPGQNPPLVYPPTHFQCAARQTGLAGHFSFSAKFICMGKQKNRLTATTPRNHSARSTRDCYPTPAMTYPVLGATLHLPYTS